MMPSNMMPSNMMPSNMMPSNMNPQCMMPSNMMPSNMMPPNMMTSNMNPQCMMPSNMMPGQQVSPEYIPSNLMPPCMVNANMSPESYPAEIPIWSNNWYGRIPPESMAADPYTYPQNLPEALRLIRNAVAGEREDELFYDYLIKVAPGNEEKEIIRSIRDDEMKHNRMFRQIYFELTGQILPPPEEVQFEKPASYMAGIQKALFGELGAVERYRKILFAMQLRKHINMVTEILTDEIKHASKYNFLYTKGRR